jgi:CheY-like chemotaxis protein
MKSFETFEHSVHEMLHHLYNPAHRPPEALWRALGIPRGNGMPALRAALLAGIERLQPPAETPPTARAWRIYGMLRYRYVDNLPAEVTAEKLGITARHLRRSTGEAIHALSLLLWEEAGGALPQTQSAPAQETEGTAAAPEAEPETEPDGTPQREPTGVDGRWHAQLLRELEALEEIAAGEAGAVANVGETLASMQRLAVHLTEPRGVGLVVAPAPPQSMAAIHPVALRHVLLALIGPLAQQMAGGSIEIRAAAQAGEVRIDLVAEPIAADTALGAPAWFAAAEEILASFSIAADLTLEGQRLALTLALLQVDRCALAVDDNLDIVHLYRRYLAGTRYALQHVARGELVWEAVGAQRPDVIVLDVMLPDVDGWDLLTRLHEHPQTRGIPVIVCSVMRERELAQALGAAHFLSKPLARATFMAALDEVLQGE